jgi:hypothetical protein
MREAKTCGGHACVALRRRAICEYPCQSVANPGIVFMCAAAYPLIRFVSVDSQGAIRRLPIFAPPSIIDPYQLREVPS